MKALDTNTLSKRAPYFVWQEHEQYLFKTDFNIVYAVEFDKEDAFDKFPAYWFDLINRNDKPSPNDPKVRATVICIIEEFFSKNPDILLYLCDSSNGQQAIRNRLFLRWFNGYEQQMKYSIRTAFTIDEGIETYISLIIQKNNPHHGEIIALFDREIRMFQQNKP